MIIKVLLKNGNPAGLIHVFQSLDYKFHFFK